MTSSYVCVTVSRIVRYAYEENRNEITYQKNIEANTSTVFQDGINCNRAGKFYLIFLLIQMNKMNFV